MVVKSARIAKPLLYSLLLSAGILLFNASITYFITNLWLKQVVLDLVAPCWDLLTVIALFWAAKQVAHQSRRLAQVLFWLGVAQLAGGIGDVIWALYEIPQGVMPFPSVADWFYLAGYPLLMLSILRVPSTRLTWHDWCKATLDMSIVLLTLSLVILIYWMAPLVASLHQTDLFSAAVALAYPLGDLIVLYAVLGLLYKQQASQYFSLYVLLSLNCLLMIILDSIYGYQSVNGSYMSGSWLDLGWVFATLTYGLIGIWQATSWQPVHTPTGIEAGRPSLSIKLTTWLAYLPYAFAIAAYLMLELIEARGEDTEHLAPWGVGSIISLVLLRQVLTLRENSRFFAQVRQSEERYRLLFDGNPQPMWVVDVETLAFLEVNQAAIHNYGYSRQEFLTMTIKDIRPATDVPTFLNYASSMTPDNSVIGIWCHQKKDGALMDVEIINRPLMLYGRPAQLVLVYDVTARRALEEQLRQAQKMETVGQLAGGIAHDFNNLLTGITGYSELALRRIQATDPVGRDLEQIKKAADRATALTRQLLAFSRKQILQPQCLDLNALVTEMEKMLRHLIGEHIQLRSTLALVLGRVQADPGQLEQVIMNLVINARDAMPDGGQLTIETANVYLDQAYAKQHLAVNAGHYIMLAISDTGTGIDVPTQKHIFEPFFTTKAVGQGTGLGLATVYGIVKQSGGHIWLYSEVGVGTIFKVYLPRVDDDAPKDTQKPEQEMLGQGTETILLAEDDELVRELTAAALTVHGYRVLATPNGSGALSVGERQLVPIDLLLTDVIMPELNGPALARGLAPLHPMMKVLYMSGYTDNFFLHQGVLAREVNFIQKPFTPAQLAAKVRAVLDG
ncbi:MAG: ATP-binding protein [Chloroflexi bacterium]|nr:ATP-binding protein [Chloroflexota bacterium]